MTLPGAAYFKLTADLRICRLLNGMWQVSGAHGQINPTRAIQDMVEYHKSGFTTWDLADHYGPAEDFIGSFRNELAQTFGEGELAKSQTFTKWVPRPAPMTRAKVKEAINISLRRMKVPALDLLQFHWWEYRNKAYLDALRFMGELQEQGKIKHLALTNFDTTHVEQILAKGIELISNQVQFSIIDRRPERKMIPFFEENHLFLLTYGTLCGGFLSERYLGQPEPNRWELKTASLQKYKQMIDAWGGWSLFQELLVALRGIAEKHRVSIPNIAMRYILEKPMVAGVIIGARLGISEHREQNAQVFEFHLDSADLAQIDAISAQSRDLFRVIGDCGDEYRG